MVSSLFWHLAAFLTGLLGSSFINTSINWWFLCLLLILSFILRKRKNYFQFFLILTFLCFGLWRGQAQGAVDKYLQAYFNRSEVWDFWVCTDPEPDWSRQISILCPLAPSFNQGSYKEKVLANLALYPQVRYGDRLKVKCRLESPPVFTDFNYAAYLAARGVGAVCSWPEIVGIEKYEEGNRILIKLYQSKRWALEKINAALPEPEAGLASALLLGYKKTLYHLEEDNFQKAGLSHIVAISGGHISLLLNLLIVILIYLGFSRNYAIWPALAGASLYVLLTGVQASAWRSLLMGAIMIYAWRRGRLTSAWAPLLLAAFIMLMINPDLWRVDLGFQLSFLAISGMISLYPLCINYIEKNINHRLRNLAKAFCLSLSAQLAVWPLLAIKSGGISLIAPLANVFAFAIFGPLVLSLLLALGLNLMLGLVDIFWYPAYILLTYLIRLCRLSALLPGSYMETPNFKVEYAWAYYIFLILIIIWFNYRRHKKFNHH
ncbi:MAG: ComEC/Rec2 family competence protein [Patescibacteria group bacterium]|nr:ComEC/Rec2 family competence protein [Patescibacteria group bacterium]